MKKYLFYSTILLICLSFKPNTDLIFDLHFSENSSLLSDENYELLEKIIDKKTSNNDSEISLEVFNIEQEQLSRERVDMVLSYLEDANIKVNKVLYYSDLSHFPKSIQSLDNYDFLRLTISKRIPKITNQALATTTKEIQKSVPVWAKPVVDYKGNQESFEVSNFSIIKIETLDGSFIKFEPESFVFEDGTLVTSPIIITTKCATSKGVAVLDELTTTFNGQLLESQGMVYVNATSEGKQLQLKEGTSYSINVKFENAQPNFQAFNGRFNNKKGQIDWFLAEDDKVELKRTKEDYFYYKTVKIPAAERVSLDAERDLIIQRWERGKLSKKQIRQRLRKYKKRRKARDTRIRKRFKEGRKTNTKRPKDGRQPRIYQSHILGQTVYKYQSYEKEFESSMSNFSLMRSNALGWNNIDKLLKESQVKPPCDLLVKAEPNINVKVVFNDFFSVFKGLYEDDIYRFPSFPSTLEVTIIGAEKLENGKVKYVLIRL